MKIEFFQGKTFLVLLSFVVAFNLISPAQAAERNSENGTENIEVYTIDTLDPETAIENGYKNVLASTHYEGSTDSSLKVVIKMVEDTYSLDGSFLGSTVTYSEAINDFTTGKMKTKNTDKSYSSPQVDNLNFKSSSLTSSELEPEKKKQYAKQLNNKIGKLKIPSDYQVKTGITKENIKQIKEATKVANTNFHLLASEAQGAFDTYYNHDTSTGKFTVQALVGSRKYVKYTGSTLGHVKNATTIAEYKGIVDDYEDLVLQQMDGVHWSEVASWVSVLTSGVIFAVGFAAGPLGWTAYYAVKTLAEVTSLFLSLTSTLYATTYRTQLSNNAAAKQRAAYVRIWGNSNWDSGTTTYTIVDGF